jgi:glycosyltransferase involved in cell wall biosynthesis
VIGISLLTVNVDAAGGTLTYVRELLRSLDHLGEHDYRVFLPAGSPSVDAGLPTTLVRGVPAGRSRAARIAGLSVGFLASGRLRRTIGAASLDAIHFPLGVMLPHVEDVPAATTVHDLQHEALPEFFSRSQRAYRRRVYGQAIRTSAIVVTISEFVRASVLERYELDPERVRVVYHGVDGERFSPGSAERQPFVLYPANRWPHKNHARLLEAFALVRRQQPALRLVLTGAGHDRTRLPPGVESRGLVGESELVELYRTASALVYPTLYEGFGLPPLEAMACGCPVAVSRVASLPEICGDAAVYFDPSSVEDVARGIADVLAHPPAGGREQAARFTWDDAARRYDAVYGELAAARSAD